jgi:hypothetical protein
MMEFHRRSLTLRNSALITMTKIRKSHTSFEMRPRASWLFMAAAVLLFSESLALAQSAPVATNEPMTFTLHTVQPMRDVLNILQKRFLSPITFEEVPYESDADLSAHGTLMIENKPMRVEGYPATTR